MRKPPLVEFFDVASVKPRWERGPSLRSVRVKSSFHPSSIGTFDVDKKKRGKMNDWKYFVCFDLFAFPPGVTVKVDLLKMESGATRSLNAQDVLIISNSS